MNIELEITDPKGVNNRGARLETGARITLGQHDGRAKAWLRFGQARLVGAEKAPEPAAPAQETAAAAPVAEAPVASVAAEPDAAPKPEDQPKPRRRRSGKKRGE